MALRMYHFAGGKDESVNILTFMPKYEELWLREGEEAPAGPDQEVLKAKAARAFGAFGGGPELRPKAGGTDVS